MVREGGGCLVEKPTEHGINIIPEKSPPAGDRTAVSSRFILDSVANGLAEGEGLTSLTTRKHLASSVRMVRRAARREGPRQRGRSVQQRMLR